MQTYLPPAKAKWRRRLQDEKIFMTYKRFKEIFRELEAHPIFNNLSELELEEYYKLEDTNVEYNNWVLRQKIKSSGIRPPVKCCLEMQYHLIEFYKEKQELIDNPDYVNYDSIIMFDKTSNLFGIPIHDGGSSYIKINFCPWCGKSLL